MKRVLALLLALSLCLVACGKKEQTPAPQQPADPVPAPPVEEKISLPELKVEFVAEGRDTEDMLRLKSEFPAVMKNALADFGVEVETVTVTFGASADATARAMAAGSVHIGFLPERSYAQAAEDLIAVVRGLHPEDETESYTLVMPVELGEMQHDGDSAGQTEPLPDGAEPSVPEDIIVGFDVLEALAAIPAEELVCAVPAEDEIALRVLEYLLLSLRPDVDFAKLENIREYTAFTSNLFEADLVVRRGMDALTDSRHPALAAILLGGTVVALSEKDKTVGNEQFCAALTAALEEMQKGEPGSSVLKYYGAAQYLPVLESEETFTRWIYGFSDEKPFL